jgi:uncharacterized membrane protein YeaQ/YmgE (transglycosylase-associated protein family)
MGLLTWVVVGAIAGWLARHFMRGSGFGLTGDIIVGVIGALVGGWFAGMLVANVGNAFSAFSLTTIVVAFIGAVVLLLVTRLLNR